jgi:membrane protein implicated in regulation of membrane protease activity
VWCLQRERVVVDGWLIWLIAASVCLIAEVFTGTLYLLVFALAGYFSAAVAGFTDLGAVPEAVVFAASSVVGGFIVRPVTRKYWNKNPETFTAVGAEALLTKTGIVTVTIPAGETHTSGVVKIQGETWSANTTGNEILEGVEVTVETITGATLTVTPKTPTEGSHSGAVTPTL